MILKFYLKNTMLRIFVRLVLLLAFTQCALARQMPYLFQQILPEKGLSHQVNAIAVSFHNGYAWMGTNTGIGRFDGYELKRYLSVKIRQIVEDRSFRIWAATGHELYTYDEQEDEFFPVLDFRGKNISALSLLSCSQGLFVGAIGCVYQLDESNRRIQRQIKLLDKPYYSVTHLALWDERTLLVSNRWSESYLVDIRSGAVRAVPFLCKAVIDLMKDHQGNFWIASYGQGVKCYSHEGTLLHEYHTGNSELATNVTLSLAEYDGKIWVGTDGEGIYMVDPESSQMAHLTHVPGDRNSLPSNSILSLYADAKNGIWAGSVRSGLFNIKEVGITLYTDAIPNATYGLSVKSVLSLYQEPSSGDIWVGTDGGGLNQFDSVRRKFYHQPSTWGDKVVSIIGMDREHLLVSLFGKGVFRYHKKSGSYVPLKIVNDEVNAALSQQGKAVNLFRHSSDEILLLSDQPYCYNWKQKTFQALRMQNPAIRINGELKPVALSENAMYVHDSKRIYTLPNSRHELNDLFSFGGDTLINAASMDEHGDIWIGTDKGLYRLTPSTLQCTSLSTNLSSNLTSVVCDHRGRVWIGCNEQLFARLIEQGSFILYGATDGVSPNEYLPKPRLLTSEGDVYLGTVNGLLCIDHELPKEQITHPVLELADVIAGGKRMEAMAQGQRVLKLKEQSFPVTLTILAKNKDIFRKPAYRYTIHRSGQPPIYSYFPTLTLNGLPAGTYQITASCSTRMGGWTEEYPILEVLVLQPWYKSEWFIMSCLLLLVLGVLTLTLWFIRRKENRLKWKMREHEKQVYEEKVRFLININHELRTPLTLIHAPLKQLIEKISPDDENYRILQGIANQSDRMKKLLNMVLDVRKMEVKESMLHLENIQLKEWMEQILEDFRPEATLKHITLKSSYEIQDTLFCCDKEKCTTVVTNLLVNALKYSNDGGEILLTVQYADSQKRIRISVSDQGVGLKNTDVKQLFTRFYQGNNSRPGTGIGLSYSKILVEQQGGSIGAFDHADGPGATFWFELPVDMHPEKKNLQPQPYLNELLASVEELENVPDEVPYQEDTKDKRILIVDDNRELVSYLASALQLYFKEVSVAYNGVEALERCRTAQPDVLVSDIQMPEMNGYELCKQVKEDFEISHIPVLLLTARTDEESKTFGYKNGADNYLTKPFEISTLYTAISSLLKNRERMRAVYNEVGVPSVPTPQESTYSPVDEKFMKKLNEVILENISSPDLGVPFLCSEMYISRASLYNKLKALTGMGANNYISKIRIERAVVMLNTTDMNISEISDAVGFSTSRYFNKVFKEVMGCSPSQYKRDRQ